MSQVLVIHWFRQDLRLSDNPSLSHAAKQGLVLPIYILDDHNASTNKIGAASRVWLHHSLQALSTDLSNKLVVFNGDPLFVLTKLVEQYEIKGIYWNRCYEPWQIARDKKIKKIMENMKVDVKSFNGSLLWEPWEALKKDGTPYKVFTPFYRKGCLGNIPPKQPVNKSNKIVCFNDKTLNTNIKTLALLPKISWAKIIMKDWQVGEKAAQKKCQVFLKDRLSDYKEGRNFPAKDSVSRLSPHLHWGEISPHQIWFATQQYKNDINADCFQSELGWREFSHHLLYHFPDLPKKNFQPKFDAFAWETNKKYLTAWKKGITGYPIIDAGMRELWQTGYMHNRVRMIVGSFLVKNLLLHWHHGEAWFWDCLVDADLANNAASWQWVAGSGADAAPYFRIFNPVTQGEKFDPHGEYTRHFVPELKNLPDKYLFHPWDAPEATLKSAGVILGKTYPKPIIDLKSSREKALAAFAKLKE